MIDERHRPAIFYLIAYPSAIRAILWLPIKLGNLLVPTENRGSTLPTRNGPTARNWRIRKPGARAFNEAPFTRRAADSDPCGSAHSSSSTLSAGSRGHQH